MIKRNTEPKLTLYRRHAAGCPIHEAKNLDACECPLWVHGKVAGGKFIRESLDTRSLTAGLAKKAARLAGTRPDDPTPGGKVLAIAPKGDITLAHATREFLASKGKKSSSTRELYKRALEHFGTFAEAQGLVKLKDVDTPHLRTYFDTNARWKRNTAQGRLTHLRVFFNHCRTRRWLIYSPAADRDLNRKQGTSATRVPFTPTQITAILAAVEQMPADVRDRARALVLLLLYSGMRISDATFCEREYLTERNTLDYFVIKTRRRIALAPEILEPALDALAKLPASRVYYFQADRDGDYHEARQALRDGEEFQSLMPDYELRIRETTALVLEVLKLAGLSGACHRFRDTFAVNLLVGNGKERTDIFTVSQMLGHSDVSITQDHYLKLIPGYNERMSQSTRVLAYQFPAAG
jgi:site-specific recombinase XerD